MAMTLEQAEAIVDTIEQANADGHMTFRARDAYSGRGMFAKTVVSLEFDGGTLCEGCILIGWAIAKLDFPMDDMPFRHDQMGRGWVIY